MTPRDLMALVSAGLALVCLLVSAMALFGPWHDWQASDQDRTVRGLGYVGITLTFGLGFGWIAYRKAR